MTTSDLRNRSASKRRPLTDAINSATKQLHSRNNAAVGARVIAAASDAKIYRQYVRDFYFVFEAFESEWINHYAYGTSLSLAKAHEPVLQRTAAFEKDLEFYYGPKWRREIEKEKPRYVKDYVEHIRTISKLDPDLMLAYGFTFYFGLFAGGSIIRKILMKRAKFIKVLSRSAPNKKNTEKEKKGEREAIEEMEDHEDDGDVNDDDEDDDDALNSGSTPGLAIFRFDTTSSPIHEIKEGFRNRLEALAVEDPTLTSRLADEAQEIFRRNMRIIDGVQGVGQLYLRWAAMFLGALAALYLTYRMTVVGL